MAAARCRRVTGPRGLQHPRAAACARRQLPAPDVQLLAHTGVRNPQPTLTDEEAKGHNWHHQNPIFVVNPSKVPRQGAAPWRNSRRCQGPVCGCKPGGCWLLRALNMCAAPAPALALRRCASTHAGALRTLATRCPTSCSSGTSEAPREGMAGGLRHQGRAARTCCSQACWCHGAACARRHTHACGWRDLDPACFPGASPLIPPSPAPPLRPTASHTTPRTWSARRRASRTATPTRAPARQQPGARCAARRSGAHVAGGVTCGRRRQPLVPHEAGGHHPTHPPTPCLQAVVAQLPGN